jgi:DNA-binding CsgD family transcriptional regulator
MSSDSAVRGRGMSCPINCKARQRHEPSRVRGEPGCQDDGFPIVPFRRLDRRRARGNATTAQRPPRRGRRGQIETIAERRTIALELRKAGGSYREIARQLSVDVHTAHADVSAELAALRERTVEQAAELRDLESPHASTSVTSVTAAAGIVSWVDALAGSRCFHNGRLTCASRCRVSQRGGANGPGVR